MIAEPLHCTGTLPEFIENYYISVCYITEVEGFRGLWPYGNCQIPDNIYD